MQAAATSLNNGGGVDRIYFYVNCATGGGTGGAWWTVGSADVSGTSVNGAINLNPAGHTCGGGTLTGQHAIVVNAELDASATRGDLYSGGRWWIVWTSHQADRKRTFFWGAPPTASVSAPVTTLERGETVSLSASASDAASLSKCSRPAVVAPGDGSAGRGL